MITGLVCFEDTSQEKFHAIFNTYVLTLQEVSVLVSVLCRESAVLLHIILEMVPAQIKGTRSNTVIIYSVEECASF